MVVGPSHPRTRSGATGRVLDDDAASKTIRRKRLQAMMASAMDIVVKEMRV